MQKSLLISLLVFLLANSCGNLPKPPDGRLCLEHSPTEGYCVTTLTQKEERLYNDEWSKLKENSALIPFKDYLKIKMYITAACRAHTDCWSTYSHLFNPGKKLKQKQNPKHTPNNDHP